MQLPVYSTAVDCPAASVPIVRFNVSCRKLPMSTTNALSGPLSVTPITHCEVAVDGRRYAARSA